jgi:uncharacterized membrane protein YqjE
MTRMSGDTAQAPESGRVRESFRDLLGQLAGHSVALLRDAIELAKQEMQGKVECVFGRLVTIVIGVVVVQAALLALCAAAVIGLTPRLGLGISTLVVGTGLAVIGGIVGFVGLQQLKQMDLKPRKTLQSLKGEQEWSKESA